VEGGAVELELEVLEVVAELEQNRPSVRAVQQNPQRRTVPEAEKLSPSQQANSSLVVVLAAVPGVKSLETSAWIYDIQQHP
jgi:hypothetical protein